MTLNNEQHTIAIVDCVYNVAYFTIIFALQTANNASLHWSEEPWTLPFANWLFPIVRFSSLNCTSKCAQSFLCSLHDTLVLVSLLQLSRNGGRTDRGRTHMSKHPNYSPELLKSWPELFSHVFLTKCVTKFFDGENKGKGGTSHLLEQIFCTFSPSY